MLVTILQLISFVLQIHISIILFSAIGIIYGLFSTSVSIVFIQISWMNPNSRPMCVESCAHGFCNMAGVTSFFLAEVTLDTSLDVHAFLSAAINSLYHHSA